MVDWFEERYISRDEHHRIVAYYTKLVAQLYSQVRELRASAAANGKVPAPSERVSQETATPATRNTAAAAAVARVTSAAGQKVTTAESGNVIRIDFRRAR